MTNGTTPAPAAPAAGVDKKLWSFLAYVLGLLTGIIAYLVAKDSVEVKFHAIQSILWSIFSGIILTVLSILFGIIAVVTFGLGLVLFPVLGLISFLLWAYSLWIGYQAYQQGGTIIKLPVVGDWAEKWSK